MRKGKAPSLGAVDPTIGPQTIRLEGLGPVREASIEVKPLTVFVGPNITGKSYTAMAVHLLNRTILCSMARSLLEPVVRKMLIEMKKEDLSNYLIEYLGKKETQDKIRNYFAKDLERELERTFAARIDDIINLESKKLSITFQTEYLESRVIFYKGDRKRSFFKIKEAGSALQWTLLGHPSFFLPAARSGILQAHRAVAALITEAAPLIPIRGVQIPQLSGAVADFIRDLLLLTEARLAHVPPPTGLLLPSPSWLYSRGFLRRMKKPRRPEMSVRFLEKILRGRIVIKEAPSKEITPDLYYKDRQLSIPIHRVSSMISELAPLYLYVKYFVTSPGLLTIEEPESHLHPEGQALIARLIANLIREGVYVVITTHSDFLLSALNIAIQWSRHREEERKKSGYENQYLRPNEVSVYLFKGDRCDVMADRLEITENGILAEEFSRVAQSLYNEYVKLQHLA